MQLNQGYHAKLQVIAIEMPNISISLTLCPTPLLSSMVYGEWSNTGHRLLLYECLYQPS